MQRIAYIYCVLCKRVSYFWQRVFELDLYRGYAGKHAPNEVQIVRFKWQLSILVCVLVILVCAIIMHEQEF